MSNDVSISKTQKLGQNPSLAVQSRFFRRGQRALEKNPFTLKWFTLFTRKKSAKAGKKFAIFLLLCLFKYSCYLVMLYFHQKLNQLAKLQFFFKFIQESMQNNYQFSFKTRMKVFNVLRPGNVLLSYLCVNCFFQKSN